MIKDPIMNLDFILKHHKMPFKLVIDVDKKQNTRKKTSIKTQNLKKKRSHRNSN